MEYVPNELLSRLVGRRLYSVQFVMDYVQLRFDDSSDELPVMNCDVLPSVLRGGTRYVPGHPGWADALTGFIPDIVRQTFEGSGLGLCLQFADGAIELNPTIDDLVGPEIALLGGFEDLAWMVWRPGEDSFEHLAQR